MAAERTSKTPTEGLEREILGSPADPAGWLERHGTALYRFAKAKLGRSDTAEDLVQETLLAALQSYDRFQGRSSERTWLLAILRRKIVDHYRGRDGREPGRNRTERSDRETFRFFEENGHWRNAPARWKGAHEALEVEEFRDVLAHCLERLPAPLAEAFLLREWEGMGVEPVAETLDVSAATLRVRLHRARLLLRECLERNWFHP